jgi:YHS domain-containing protein
VTEVSTETASLIEATRLSPYSSSIGIQDRLDGSGGTLLLCEQFADRPDSTSSSALQARSKPLSTGDAFMPLQTLFSAIVGCCLFTSTLVAGSPVWKTDFDAARLEAQKQQRPLLVHFYSDSCAPCVQMEQNVLHKAPIEEYIQGNLVAVSVNVDQHSELQKRFSVNRWPCDFVLDPSGSRRLVTSTGPRSIADYRQMLEKAVTWNAQLQARAAKPAPQPIVGSISPNPAPLVQAPVPTYSSDKLLLEGYSPVSLLTDKKWIKGTSEFAVDFEGQWFLLTSSEEIKAFRSKPENFVPQFMGCDPVLLWESEQVPAMRGVTRFAAFYDDQLYLFASKENRDRFKESPDRFITTRVVLDLDLIETVTR